MLTMTVMQNDIGAVGQFSTEPAEAEDVLSRLRHLHRTLKECHWRVQVVDHALCAQGEGDKEHHGQQNQTGSDHSFESQVSKDNSIQNQTKEDYSLQPETVKGYNLLDKAEKDQDVEEQVSETLDAKEELENHDLEHQSSENQNRQKGDREEFEDQLYEDDKHQMPDEEKHSLPHNATEDQKLPIQPEAHNNQDLSNEDNEKVGCFTDNNRSSIPMNDHILQDYGKKDDYIHDETEERNYIHNSFKEPWCGDKYSSETKQNKCLARQDGMDLGMKDLMPIDTKEFSSFTTLFNHDSSDLILPLSSRQKGHHVGKVRHRSDNVQELEYEIFDDGDREFFRNLKKEDVSQEHQRKNEEVPGDIYTRFGYPAPEVNRKMDMIWEALENLRSHFLSLHSSLVDSSNLFCTDEFAESSDKITSRKSEEIIKCSKLHTMLDDLTSETMQLHQIPAYQSSLGKLPVRHQCGCQNQISSLTCLEKPVNSAALNDVSKTARTYLRNWRDNCLCIMTAVVLLLLFLFLASCLLLILPVVSVSVRTAGGLPAF